MRVFIAAGGIAVTTAKSATSAEFRGPLVMDFVGSTPHLSPRAMARHLGEMHLLCGDSLGLLATSYNRKNGCNRMSRIEPGPFGGVSETPSFLTRVAPQATCKQPVL